MSNVPMLAATLPMPPLPVPVQREHFRLQLERDGEQIVLVCWCGEQTALDTYDAWTGRCIQRFCHNHAACQSAANLDN